ncbi:Inner membrane symporter YihP [compost metagenome]
MLTQIGYIPNIEQSASVLKGLRELIFIYPCVLAMVAAVMMGFFYKLNEQLFMQIITEINNKKGNRDEQAELHPAINTTIIKEV